MSLQEQIIKIAKEARKLSYQLALISTDEKDRALKLMANALLENTAYLIRENKKDIQAAPA